MLDFIVHYENHIKPKGFKAQVVAVTREATVIYKEMFDVLSYYESKVIISGGHSDEERMRKHHLSKDEEKKIFERFKKPMSENSLSFIIV